MTSNKIGGHYVLFDLTEDPKEMVNLSKNKDYEDV
jgi:hypothetical protein